MIVAGIDAGSRTIKVVLLNRAGGRVAAAVVADQGLDQGARAARLLDRALRAAGGGRRDVARVVATGWGRAAVTAADATVTEITCQARGVHARHPGARTVIDIGGQDSKVLRLEPGGRVRDFAMNDRCAAGTGRFLEVVAARLEVAPLRLGALAAAARRPATISSTCVVFAETEIVALLAAGVRPANLAAGVLAAVAGRVAALAGRAPSPPVLLTGGVALIPGMARALAAALGCPVRVARQPQFTGALGAALLAGGGA